GPGSAHPAAATDPDVRKGSGKAITARREATVTANLNTVKIALYASLRLPSQRRSMTKHRASTRPARQRPSYHVGNLGPQLLDAAREMLAEVGPTRLSLRAVSERVGVSSTAAYHHFANRAALLEHLAAQGFRELEQTLARREPASSKEQLLRSGTLAYFSFARQNPELYQLMFGPELASSEATTEMPEARARAFAEVMKIIAEILDRGPNSPEVRAAAVASWSYVHGLASLIIHGVLKFAPDNTDESLIDRTLAGFANLFRIWLAEQPAPTTDRR